MKDILEKWSGTRAVALYNPADTAAFFSVQPEELEFKGDLKIRDLNQNRDLGVCGSIEMTLQPHSAKILKVEGRRAEPVKYEAEWGYCPEFTAIRGTGVKYVPMEGASGRVVAMNLGGSEKNCLEWKDVHSVKGGAYTISLTVANVPEMPAVHLSVNGNEAALESVENAGDFVTLRYSAKLAKGKNSVRIWNADTLIPAVDRLELERQ
ncbi:MAG: hypothetical protein PUA96_04840 [Bacteroidales bacterium]|nr:hypothetical protein [Bacteroidales bacterium]